MYEINLEVPQCRVNLQGPLAESERRMAYCNPWHRTAQSQRGYLTHGTSSFSYQHSCDLHGFIIIIIHTNPQILRCHSCFYRMCVCQILLVTIDAWHRMFGLSSVWNQQNPNESSNCRSLGVDTASKPSLLGRSLE